MLAFNWFFLPPRHTFTLADGENWFALAVYLGTAVVVSELAARPRRRAAAAEQRERESALLAELADRAARRAEARGRGRRDRRPRGAGARRRVGRDRARPARRGTTTARLPHPLEAAGRQVGTIYMPPDADPNVDVAPAVPARARRAARRRAPSASELEQRGARGRDAAPQRPRQDRAAARRLARPALAADRDPDGDRRAAQPDAEPERRRPRRAARDDRGRVGPARPARRRPARPLAARGGRGAARSPRCGTLDDLVRQAVDDARRARPRRGRRRDAARRRRRGPDPAGAREPDRERAQVLAAGRARARADHRDAEGGDRPCRRPGPGLPDRTSSSASSSLLPARGDPRAGAGLGLAIARGFAEANGGRVWAESRPGQGATFALALPVVEVPAELAVE